MISYFMKKIKSNECLMRLELYFVFTYNLHSDYVTSDKLFMNTEQTFNSSTIFVGTKFLCVL